MDYVGVHMLITIRDVPDSTMLETVSAIKPILDTIVKKCYLHVVAEAGHQFEPYGATYVYVLSESHMSIHTYPEKRSAYMDIFCCNLGFDTSAACSLIKELFKTECVDVDVRMR